jgi:hypothetical protein
VQLLGHDMPYHDSFAIQRIRTSASFLLYLSSFLSFLGVGRFEATAVPQAAAAQVNLPSTDVPFRPLTSVP